MARSDERKDAADAMWSPVQGRLDRRSFFRGAVMLGGVGATSLLPSFDPRRAVAAEPQQNPTPTPGAAKALSAQTERILRWTSPSPSDWVRPRDGVDHNVVIVGGGQTGLTLAYGLR